MSLAPEHDSYRMTSTLSTHHGETEAECHTSYSSYFLYDDANVAPIDPYMDAFGGIHTSPTFTKASNYNPYSPSNTFSTEPAAALDSQFAGAIYSPSAPKNCVSVPFTTSSNGIDSTISFNGWQVEADSLMQTSPGMQWWRAPVLPGSNNHTVPSSRILEPGTSNTNSHNAESTSLSNAAADESQHQTPADSLHLGSPLKRKVCGTAAPRQGTKLDSKVTGTTNPSEIPMAVASGVSFDLPDANARPDPRPPVNSRASPRGDAQQTMQSSSSPVASRPGQRARNRTAAIKCRTKTKAAAAELAATEKAESSRHEGLLMTLRGLQEDVFALKSEILLHGNCGDGLIQDYLNSTARSLATG